MKRSLPSDQSQRDQAIFERAHDVIVMAGAGTGKTELLSSRYVELIAPEDDSKDAIPPNRLAAITFTRRAAGEIKNRILGKLFSIQKLDQLTKIRAQRLANAIEIIDTSIIGTIHGFADRMLCLKPIEAMISPKYQLQEYEEPFVIETAKRLIEGSKANDLSMQWSHSKHIPDASLVKRTEDFFNQLTEAGIKYEDGGRSDFVNEPGIVSTVRNCIHNRDKKNPKYQKQPPYNFENSDKLLSDLQKDLQRALQEDKGGRAFKLLRSASAQVGKIIGNRNLGQRAFVFSRLFSSTKGLQKAKDCNGSDVAFSVVKGLRGDETGKEPKTYWNDIYVPMVESLLGSLPEVYPVIISMYEDVKRRHETIDQMDLLLKFRDVLDRPDVKSFYKSQFDHIFVDEFQDTDPIQAEIILALGEERGSLTIIGDPKQSIYRFRNADISEFAHVVEELKARGAVESRLSVNFRSNSALIGGINDAFSKYLGVIEDGSQEFNAEDGSVAYSPLESHTKVSEEPAIRFLQFDCQGLSATTGGRQAEAVFIARYIHQLIHGSGDIKVKPCEIAVLSKVMMNVGLLANELKKIGVDVYLSGGTVFAESKPLRKFIYLLALVSRENANGRSLLYSYEASTEVPIALLNSDEKPAIEKWLADLRENKAQRTVFDTAMRVLNESVFGQSVAVSRESEDTLTNLLRFVYLLSEEASNHDWTYDQAIDWALTWLTDPPKIGSPMRLGENAVQILSIHQSKGLEFPVTILFDSFTSVSKFRPDAFACKKDGTEWFTKIGKFTTEYPRNSNDFEEAEKRNHENEQKRLQYVAATRAKDFLIIPFNNKPKGSKGLYKHIWECVAASENQEIHIYPEANENTLVDHLSSVETVPPYPQVKVNKTLDAKIEKLAKKHNDMLNAASTSSYKPTSPSESENKSSDHFEWDLELNLGLTASGGGAELGTLVHEVLYLYLIKRHPLEDILGKRVQEKFRSSVKEHVTNTLKVLETFDLSTWELFGEVPFSLHLDEEGQLMNGVIDLVLKKSNEILIVDYKTDIQLTESILQTYSSQLKWYSMAILKSEPTYNVKAYLLGTKKGLLQRLKLIL